MQAVFAIALTAQGLPAEGCQFVRLPPPNVTTPYILRFQLIPGSNALLHGELTTNYPPQGEKFDRNRFHTFKFEFDGRNDGFAQFPISQAGAFEYFVDYPSSLVTAEATSRGYFIVDPMLEVELSGHEFPSTRKFYCLDSLCILTVVSKWLGPLNAWPDHFKSIADSGYNMVHFTPLQARGISGSPYSIYDQLKFSPDLFPATVTSQKDQNFLLTGEIESLAREFGILSITDIVWNHTASNSYWLEIHPEAGYNLENSPHLKRAYEIDEAILAFSSIIETVGCPVQPTSGTEVNQVLNCFANYLRSSVKFVNFNEFQADFGTIIENIKNRVIYERVDSSGPRLGKICRDNPLVSTYFSRIKRTEANKHLSNDALIVANNGWIWNADPLIDFAGPKSNSYLLREVIPWGDCVKLRYGQSKADCPWLWEHMEQYTKLMATIFSGFRIDNCHSTPIHVAQYFLDKAREVRPNLYVIAELFTGSEQRDILFVSKLGINSLIREAMNAWNAPELSRLVHRYGGQPVGSLAVRADYLPLELIGHSTAGNTLARSKQELSEIVINVKGSSPHAVFMDCTHDNETSHQKRTAVDSLPNAALVAMSSCAIGSTKGYDDVIPLHLNVVTETRRYQLTSLTTGITAAKSYLLKLHIIMAQNGYSEIHVHQEGDFIVVSRQHPLSHRGYVLVAHTGFKSERCSTMSPMILRNTKWSPLLSTRITVDASAYVANQQIITGLPCSLEIAYDSLLPKMLEVTSGKDELGAFCKFAPNQFPPGAIVLLKTDLFDGARNGFEKLASQMRLSIHAGWYLDGSQRCKVPGLSEACASLEAEELNIVLFRSDAEERDLTEGHGVYDIPGVGLLPFAGLQGWISLLEKICSANDLGHALCSHLRSGYWALDYIVERMRRHHLIYPRLQALTAWFEERFTAIKALPNFLVPKYFNIVLATAFRECKRRSVEIMSPFIQNGCRFTHNLALCSFQFYGRVNSAGLSPMTNIPSIAAGLPHFSTNHMRCWGRDVFISLRGLYLTTGLYEIAATHILCFAACVKHGLVPNLLDSGRFPRYNARDATWFFLQSIQDYVNMAPNGVEILSRPVKRRFLNDEYSEWNSGTAFTSQSSLGEVVQEIMQRHAEGIHFVEWNAGPKLDHAMRDAGFNIDIEFVKSTGFIFGGNRWNCGTWMDKMGESDIAGTKGVPATPRDGAAVEVIGLVKSSVRWLADLSAKGMFFQGVKLDGESYSYKLWNDRIQQNFERIFYIPDDPADDHKYQIDVSLVNSRAIYKDTVKSELNYSDYQLRPNVCVAMVVAPELFSKDKAQKALDTMGKRLLGPLGIKTLDPADMQYRPNYDNGNCTSDGSIAKGFNYHQGPEWLWIAGYFVRAMMLFTPAEKKKSLEFRNGLYALLLEHRQAIERNPWAGLPELTNDQGSFCRDSCPTQAWSAAVVLDILYDLSKI
eukprot:Partr_v1_DN28316_c0_g1_i2_m78910 putative Glycogen debranching enzyme